MNGAPRRGQGRKALASYSMGAIELSSRNPVRRSYSFQATIANNDHHDTHNINKYIQGVLLCIMAATLIRMGATMSVNSRNIDPHRRIGADDNVNSISMSTFAEDDPSVLSALRESVDKVIIEKSIQHIEPPSDIKAAVCYKTLFGDIDLRSVLQWVAYNRLLGFDHIHMFYREEIKQKPYWKVLSNLPYVTLRLNERGSSEDYYEQWWTEKQCLEKYANKYDYVMIADIDEYLVLPIQYNGVNDFLSQQKKDGKTYLSFGKYMYTLDYKLEHTDTNTVKFEVANYPFYMKYFCYGRRKGHPHCPTWKGRAKVIVDPKIHQRVNVHGIYYHPNHMTDAIHFHPDEARFNEWPTIFIEHNITKRKPEKFEITDASEVHIHNLEQSFMTNENGKYDVWYDAELSNWFQSVANRASASSTS